MNLNRAGEFKPLSKVLRLCLFFFFVLLLTNCSQKSDSQKFAQKLTKIDVLMQNERFAKAHKSLKILEKSANTSTQWLSIVKRYITQDKPQEALECLSRALVGQPANDRLLAAKAFLLMQEGGLDTAFSFYSMLNTGSFFNIADSLALLHLQTLEYEQQDAYIWLNLWHHSQDPLFLRNALASSVLKQNSFEISRIMQEFDSEKLSVSDVILEAALYMYMHSFEQSIAILEQIFDFKEDIVVRSLIADAYYSIGDRKRAIEQWMHVAQKYSNFYPGILFNLASFEKDWKQKKIYLYEGVRKFPSYYPLVKMFVDLACGVSDVEDFEAIEKELLMKGFETKIMVDKKNALPIPLHDAQEVLEHALFLAQSESDTKSISLDELVCLELTKAQTQLCFDSTQKTLTPFLWNISERYPDTNTFWDYFLYYHIANGNIDLARGYFIKYEQQVNSLYKGIFACADGDLEKAKKIFHSYSGNIGDEWCAIANLAKIAEKEKEYAAAIEFYTMALGKVSDAIRESQLHLEIARIMQQHHNTQKAIQILEYALELDPHNYEAKKLKNKLELPF